MIKFHNIKIRKLQKIRYLKISQKKNTFLIFLHGFMSDLEGKKPKFLYKFANYNKLGFLALEYSGHGKSSGKFTEGNISKWTKEANYLIKKGFEIKVACSDSHKLNIKKNIRNVRQIEIQGSMRSIGGYFTMRWEAKEET